MQESVTLPPLGVVLVLWSALARGMSAHAGPRGEKWRARRPPRGMSHCTFQELGLVAASEAGSGASRRLCSAGVADGEVVLGLQEEADNGNRTVSVLCCLLPRGKAERGQVGREKSWEKAA